MKRILFLMLLSLIFVEVFSQDLSEKYPKNELRPQNRDIMRQYRKMYRRYQRCCVRNPLPPYDSIIICNFYNFEYDNSIKLTKDFVESPAFLNSLYLGRGYSFKEKLDEWIHFGGLCMRRWPRYRSYALVMSFEGDLLAFYDGYELHRHNVGWEAAMAKYIVENEIVSVFDLSVLHVGPVLFLSNYFGVDKQGGIHVFYTCFRNNQQEPCEYCPLSEFPDELWPNLFFDPWKGELEKMMKASTPPIIRPTDDAIPEN